MRNVDSPTRRPIDWAIFPRDRRSYREFLHNVQNEMYWSIYHAFWLRKWRLDRRYNFIEVHLKYSQRIYIFKFIIKLNEIYRERWPMAILAQMHTERETETSFFPISHFFRASFTRCKRFNSQYYNSLCFECRVLHVRISFWWSRVFSCIRLINTFNAIAAFESQQILAPKQRLRWTPGRTRNSFSE